MSKEIKEKKDIDKTFISKHKIIIIIILIFVLAFAVRGHLLKYKYLYEFDPYWHLRATSYVLQGDLPENDPLGFYQNGGSSYEQRPKLLWYLTSLIYIITTLGAGYNKWLLMNYARILPAIFGALISVAMYFLGKELYNKKAGIVMGIVAATIPAFVYRTMAGFFEEDALGFLWMILGFIFFIKAIKNMKATKRNLTYGIISAVLFSLMAMTWDMFLLIPLIMVAYFVVNIIYMALKNTSNYHIASFIKIFLVVAVIFMAITCISRGTGWIDKTAKYVKDYMPINHQNIDRFDKKAIDSKDVIGASVGEENKGLKFFFMKYNFLVFIPFLCIILIPLYLIFSKKKDYSSLIIFFWILITTFMAASKLKFTYTLGLPIAAGAGFLFYIYYEWVKDKTIFAKRVFSIIFIVLLLTSIAAGSNFVATKVPPIDESPDWQNVLFWLHDNTPETSKIFNWWDNGHWITYFAERKASTDNTNSDLSADSDFAKFIISDDINISKNLLKKYDADYVVTDNSNFNKFNSFASYAYVTTNYSDPKVSKYFGAKIPCSARKTKVTNKITYVCGNFMIAKKDFDTIKTIWDSNPSDIMNGQPVFIYKSEDNKNLFLFNSEINNSIFTKIWFNNPETSAYMDLVHKSGGIRVYKINKEYLLE